jgi:hypothetical protein
VRFGPHENRGAARPAGRDTPRGAPALEVAGLEAGSVWDQNQASAPTVKVVRLLALP